MDRKTAISKIKVLFGLEKEEEKKKVLAASFVLEDGKTVAYDALEVGYEIFYVLEDGSYEILPDGQYVIDGFTVTVVGGKIESVVKIEEQVIEQQEVQPDVTAEIAELKSAIIDMVSVVEGLNSAVEQLLVDVELLKNSPAKQSVTEQMNNDPVVESRVERFQKYLKTN